MRLLAYVAMALAVAAAATCPNSFAAPAGKPQLTVEAPDVTLANAPVQATLAGTLPEGSVVSLTPTGGGEPVTAQVERTGSGGAVLRWIEPKLDAGKSKSYTVSAAAAPAADDPVAAFRFVDGDGFRDLRFGDAGVWRDMIKYDPADRDNTFKPFKHVFRFDTGSANSTGGVDAATTSTIARFDLGNPADAPFITKGPGGLYTHHRGIFFGFNRTPFGDFWHCTNGASQRHAKYLADREFAGPVAARSAQVVDWVDKEGVTVVRDTRQVTTWRVSPSHLVLDFDITVEALAEKPVTLGGDAHHAGFHFRAAQEVAQRPATRPSAGDDATNAASTRTGATPDAASAAAPTRAGAAANAASAAPAGADATRAAAQGSSTQAAGSATRPRAANANNATGGATYVRPAGATLARSDTWERGDWVHCTFTVAGRPYGVTHFDAPTNPRPIRYSTRPYGRFGSFFESEVTKGKPLQLRYRLIVRDGATPPTPEQLDAEYKAFATPARATLAAE